MNQQNARTERTPKTYYKILDVPTTAPFEVIKTSYQQKARKFHPDKRQSSSGNDEFLQLQKAWECLRDPKKRRDYDAQLAIQERHKTKGQEIFFKDMELVEEEDSGELCYLHPCRCGEHVWLPEASLKNTKGSYHVTCEGCSLVYYTIIPKSFNQLT